MIIGRRICAALIVPMAAVATALGGDDDCTPQWAPLGAGVSAELGAGVAAITVFDDGSGPALCVGGAFTEAGEASANNVARWDGAKWWPLGAGIDGVIHSLAVYDDGSGPALYAGGEFTHAGGSPASNIAQWDGASWTPLGEGVSGGTSQRVYALCVFDDGNGAALYAAGDFSEAGGQTVGKIARWDGVAWSSVGSGIEADSFGVVFALTVYDDGSGPALYAGGFFDEAGESPASKIARWDGTDWLALGTGVDYVVNALTVFDDGSGPALYAGGSFNEAGGLTARNIARWDGSEWSALGLGTNGEVLTLTAFDDGSGPALYAGGAFVAAGGQLARFIARWDGASWSSLQTGMNGFVRALATFDSGNGPALHAGGLFTHVFGSVAKHVARLEHSCAPDTCSADVTGDDSIDLADLNLVLTNFGQTIGVGDTNDDGVVNLTDLNAVLADFGTDCP